MLLNTIPTLYGHWIKLKGTFQYGDHSPKNLEENFGGLNNLPTSWQTIYHMFI